MRSKKKTAARIPFSALLEGGYLKPGQKLYFRKDKQRSATIKPDARLRTNDGFEGSIHRAGAHLMDGSPCNGWEHWYLQDNGDMVPLDDFRKRYRIEQITPDG
ncbi:MAG TPA: hypothetical protein QGI62_07305 [Anaerolineales bacterium]|nr:hypothetical protein [Anaerolineales bacterium]